MTKYFIIVPNSSYDQYRPEDLPDSLKPAVFSSEDDAKIELASRNYDGDYCKIERADG
jgi:hypothetical protein